MLKELSAAAIAGLAIMLVLLGGLIPRWMHKERVSDKDRQISYLQAALDKRDEQVDKLVEKDQTVIQLLEGLKAEAERRRSR